MKRNARLVLVLMGAMWGTGCADFEKSDAMASPMAEPAAQTASGDTAQEAQQARKLIQRAELSVTVESYEDARQRIDGRLEAMGGHVEHADVSHASGKVLSATLVLRVPSAQLGEFLTEVGDSGEVTYESIQAEDVTEAYADNAARLRAAKKLEDRLLELMSSKTESVADLLAVEKELGRVRQEIETLEGKMRLYDNQIDLSTVTLRIATERPPVSSSLSDRAARTLDASGESLIGFGEGLLLLLIALLPWSPLLLALALGLRFAYRRWLKSRPAAAPHYAYAYGYAAPAAQTPAAPQTATARAAESEPPAMPPGAQRDTDARSGSERAST